MSLLLAIRKQKFSFGAVAIPWAAFIIFALSGNLLLLDYIHVLTGAIWTGTDIFLGLIFIKVVKTLDIQTKYDVAQRVLPMTLFFIPSATVLTTLAGLILAIRENTFSELPSTLIIPLFAVGAILAVISFIFILPASLKIRKMKEGQRDEAALNDSSRLLDNLTIYGAVQLLFQIIIIGFMAYFVAL